jgi:hypothetical protein
MMKRKIIITACALLFFYNYVSAQDVFIVAYKGKVNFNDGRILQNNFKYVVNRNNTLTFPEGASALVFTKDKYFVIEKISLTTTYSYAQFVNKLNKNSSGGFMAYLQKTHLFLNEVKESSKGATVAGIKGFNENEKYVKDPNETIFPQDSVRALSATIKLKWETTGKAYGTKMIVVNITLNDTVYNKQASGKGEMDLMVEKEGTYNWFLYSRLENKKSIERVIIKPSPAEISRLQRGLDDFKKQIASFSEELQVLLLDDYLYQNHISE